MKQRRYFFSQWSRCRARRNALIVATTLHQPAANSSESHQRRWRADVVIGIKASLSHHWRNRCKRLSLLHPSMLRQATFVLRFTQKRNTSRNTCSGWLDRCTCRRHRVCRCRRWWCCLQSGLRFRNLLVHDDQHEGACFRVRCLGSVFFGHGAGAVAERRRAIRRRRSH